MRPLSLTKCPPAPRGSQYRSTAAMSWQRTLPAPVSDFEFAEEFLPVYDVSDAVATVADADRESAWRALVDVDLLNPGRDAPVVGILGGLRMLPEVIGQLLHGG